MVFRASVFLEVSRMRLHEVSSNKGYVSLVLDNKSKNMLKSIFPPKYPDFIGHHITVAFGVDESYIENINQSNEVSVVGYADDGESLEALVVEVDGTHMRPDGKIYHITWSLDRSKGRKPVHSNDVIKDHKFNEVDNPISINTMTKFTPFK